MTGLASDGGLHHGADPKTRLQELCQRQTRTTPAYRLLEQSGPPHSPNFNPVNEFVALASPNHGLRLISTSLAIQQLGNGIWGFPCTAYSSALAAAFMSKLNGLDNFLEFFFQNLLICL